MEQFTALVTDHHHTNETMDDHDEEEYPSIRFITNGLVAGIFISAGIIANIAVITSWLLDRTRWLPLYYYFMAFASWNLTLLISTLFFYSLPAILKQPADQSTIESVPYYYVIGYAGANCCLTAVVWLMVVLTIERYIAVVLPFHTRVSSPRRRAKLISGSLSLLAILYNIPLIFELRIVASTVGHSFETQAQNAVVIPKTYWMVDTAPFRSNFYYQTIYRVVFNLLFISLTPFITICLLTFKIVLLVHRANAQRAIYRRPTLKASSGAEAKVSITSSSNFPQQTSNAATYGNILLTLFVVKFLVCYTIPFALNVSELFLPVEIFQTEALMWITDASDFLVILDSVSNAFLYSSWRKRIRLHKRKPTVISLSSCPAEDRRRSASYYESSAKDRNEKTSLNGDEE